MRSSPTGTSAGRGACLAYANSTLSIMTTTTATQTLQPYLFFGGRCDEALTFYRQALGAQIETLMRFKDAPEQCGQPVNPERVMHASVRVGGATFMVSDGCDDDGQSFEGFSLSLAVPDETEAKRVFSALSDQGEVGMPLGKTFFAPCFGMVTDRFGVSWMVIVLKTD